MVVGDPYVGKSWLLKSYVTGVTPDEYAPTVVDNYSVTTVVSYQ